MINPQDKATLTKYTQVVKKVVYNPARMKELIRLMGTKEGALTAVQSVVAAIDKIRPVPPQIAPLLGVNAYMVMVDVAQEATDQAADPRVMEAVIQSILAGVQTGQSDPEEPGDAPGADNTMEHEGAEAPQYEQGEGSEEDPMGEEDDNVMARLRKGVPA